MKWGGAFCLESLCGEVRGQSWPSRWSLCLWWRAGVRRSGQVRIQSHVAESGAENVEAWRHLQRFPARMDSRPRPSRRHTDLAVFGRNGIQQKIKANNVWRWGTLLGELLSDTSGILLSPFGPFLYIWSWLSTSVPCTQSGIKPSRVWNFSLIEMLRHYIIYYILYLLMCRRVYSFHIKCSYDFLL